MQLADTPAWASASDVPVMASLGASAAPWQDSLESQRFGAGRDVSLKARIACSMVIHPFPGLAQRLQGKMPLMLHRCY